MNGGKLLDQEVYKKYFGNFKISQVIIRLHHYT
jgi:hypothetical protein